MQGRKTPLLGDGPKGSAPAVSVLKHAADPNWEQLPKEGTGALCGGAVGYMEPGTGHLLTHVLNELPWLQLGPVNP